MSSIIYKDFEPMQDRVLVRPHKPEEKTSGGIIIPDSMQKPIPGGVIIGMGEFICENTDFKVGDKVLYGEHAGFTVSVDGEDLVLMRGTDIYARNGKLSEKELAELES